jgi:hypothetical protein
MRLILLYHLKLRILAVHYIEVLLIIVALIIIIVVRRILNGLIDLSLSALGVGALVEYHGRIFLNEARGVGR